METKEVFIESEKHFDKPSKFREGCRGLIIKDGKILLSCFTNEDFYLIPGGGIEPGEDLKEACTREVEEETALIVKPEKQFLEIKLYFEEWLFTSNYFICSVEGDGKFNLTDNERNRGLEPRWVDLDKALEIFGTYPQYEKSDVERHGSYKREFTALSYYLQTQN